MGGGGKKVSGHEGERQYMLKCPRRVRLCVDDRDGEVITKMRKNWLDRNGFLSLVEGVSLGGGPSYR